MLKSPIKCKRLLYGYNIGSYGENMRKLMIGAALIFLIPLSALAQQEFPKVEAFGGYSFFKGIPRGNNLNGWSAGATRNINRWLGIEGNISRHTGSPQNIYYGVPGRETGVFSFLFGPKLSYRAAPVTLFAHFLIGLNHYNVADPTDTEFRSGTHFSAAIGGGIDININKDIAIQPIQMEY